MDSTTAASDVRASGNSSLRHILLVAGTLDDWSALPEQAWCERVDALGGLCSHIGVPWLTVRAYEQGPKARSDVLAPWRRAIDGCEVIIDPCGDGRQRFADAMERLDPSDAVNEATVASVLYEPADCEPDLVVVLGPPTQLPPSLVWELAYAELVFLPVEWSELNADDLSSAISEFSNRRRRFGGLDE